MHAKNGGPLSQLSQIGEFSGNIFVFQQGTLISQQGQVIGQ